MLGSYQSSLSPNICLLIKKLSENNWGVGGETELLNRCFQLCEELHRFPPRSVAAKQTAMVRCVLRLSRFPAPAQNLCSVFAFAMMSIQLLQVLELLQPVLDLALAAEALLARSNQYGKLESMA